MKKGLLFILALLMLNNGSLISQKINGAGSTFAYPIFSAWSYDYHKVTKIQLNYQSIGSGGGVRQVVERTVDFGASDDPLSPERLEQDKLLQFPSVIGGVVPIVNIPGIANESLKLDPEVLARIFMEEISYWDDPAIVKINPDLKLPHEKITTVHRSDGSGTTAIFVEYLSRVFPEFKAKVGVGKSVSWPGGIGAKGNEGVANYVKRVKFSIGYVEFAYAKQNKLNVALLKNRDGNYVAPRLETFQAAAANAEWDLKNHFYLWLVNEPGKDSWPITGAVFVLMPKEKVDNNKNVVRFFEWCFVNGDDIAKRLEYVPLPENVKNMIRSYWRQYQLIK